MFSDNSVEKCYVAITIIDKSKIAFSDNNKKWSIDNYRSIIIADNAHHWLLQYSWLNILKIEYYYTTRLCLV